MDKKALRDHIQKQIESLSLEAKQAESISVCNEVITLLGQYDFETLVSYTAFPDEIDTSSIHTWCETHKKKIFLIPQTTEEITLPVNSIILVPGRAFTRAGVRLGRWNGFYDKLLEKSEYILTIGLAFGCQIVLDIPEDSWDKRVDEVVFVENILE
jgi:5-formyltetrahydrofolate cyclo-ligase